MSKRPRRLARKIVPRYGFFAAGIGLVFAGAVMMLIPGAPDRAPSVPLNKDVTVLPVPSPNKVTAPGAPSTGSTSSPPSTTSVVVPPQSSQVGVAVPAKPIENGVRISIPAIGVDAPVVSLGLNSDGTLQVPSSFSVAGWWSGGPFPGQPGPAVIVGHVASVAGPGVFYRLGQLVPGDLITVSQPSGSSVIFTVVRSVEVSKSNFPTQLVYGPIADAGLRLITCTGTFDSSTGHFDDNLIVFAKLSSKSS
jgi:sortase (surface protein transpeptidase)